MATTAVETLQQITGEIGHFDPLLTQSFLQEEFDQLYQPIASLNSGGPIEFNVTSSERQYLDLNNSRLCVRVKITKADGTNLDADTAGPINLTLHSLFKDVYVELNNKAVSDSSQMYPYRAYVETVLNFNEETQKTRLLTEGWVKDTTGHMDVTNVGGANLGLKSRTTRFARSAIVELVGRPHLDIFHQDRLIPPGVSMFLKLIRANDSFVIKSAAPQGQAAQENFKVVLEKVHLLIHKKKLSADAEMYQLKQLEQKTMRLAISRVEVRHLTITANDNNFYQDAVFRGTLPDMVIIGLVAEADFAGGYQRNPFNFQHFDVNKIELKRNHESVPTLGYNPDFTNKHYINDYFTMLGQVNCHNGNQNVSLTPEEWATGYTLYAFKITAGPIGSGTEVPRSHSNSGVISLRIGFSKAPTANVKVIVFSQGFGLIEIDSNYRVVVS